LPVLKKLEVPVPYEKFCTLTQKRPSVKTQIWKNSINVSENVSVTLSIPWNTTLVHIPLLYLHEK